MGVHRTKKKKAGRPSFDEDALAQLTNKIDRSLAGSETQRPRKRKRPRENEDAHGTKRRQTRPSESSTKDLDGEGENEQVSTLLEEILALGGTEDDLDLVANVDSGDEGNGASRPKASPEPTIDKSLRDELSRFAQNLGFSNFRDSKDPDTDGDSDFSGDMSDHSADDDSVDGDGGEVDGGFKVEHSERIQPLRDIQQGNRSGKLRFEPRPDWHALSLDGLSSQKLGTTVPHSPSISSLKAYAEKLLDEDSSSYLASRASSSSQKFMSTIMSSGTLSDKVSALTLSIQESPLHNRKAFESLVGLAGKRSRGQAIAALGALVDLLGNGTVLPGDRRLYSFATQPALLAELKGSSPWSQGQQLPGGLTEPHLMMWAFEDWLKAAYFRIIQLLEIWCSDEIEYSRSRALDFVFGLLKSKPEQEANLLRLLVNKLGDRERKIASRASYLILQLLNVHPGMKAIVINTVEQVLLLKPGQSLRAKYTAINTLNQTILSMKEPAIANTLLRIYFDMFLSLLKSGSLGDMNAHDGVKKPGRSRKKGKQGAESSLAPTNEQDTAQKLVSSLLTGVNRAIPFATAEDSTLEKHLDTLFRITHSSNFNTSVQSLMLIQQLAASKQLAVDRFYRTLYESLLDPRLITSSKHALYLNLLFRAMKNDVDVRRVKAFVKRLVQILTLHQPSFTCGILYLIAEIQSTFPDLHTLLEEPENHEDDGEEVYRDVQDDKLEAISASQEHDLSETKSQRMAAYDGRKRDPEHSNAHRSCLWELTPFLGHYHPSVCLFAGNLLSRQKALPKPDLANHTLMHFLDRFVYRNPKSEVPRRGGSIMQPILASGNASHIVVNAKGVAKQQSTVNSSSFWNLATDQVAAEDVFFHEYFSRIGRSGEAAGTKKMGSEPAVSDDEAAGEEEIWGALVNSQPDIEGMDGEDDFAMDLGEYDYSDHDVGTEDLDADDKMSGLGSERSEDGGAFEGIFDDSEASDGTSAGEYNTEDEEAAGPRRAPPGEARKGRLSRKEMKSLPTFASVDDYAELLAAEDHLDI